MKASSFALVLACAACVPQLAFGQAADDPNAVKLADQRFSEALAMMEAKRFAEACALFEESQRLAPGGGTLLNLADCYEQLGRLAKASETFTEARDQAQRTGNVARQQVAQKRIEALAPRLAHVVVMVAGEVAGATPGLSVALDGTDLPSGEWAKPKAVDPGTHVIRVTAPGHQAREIALSALAAGDTRTAEIPALRPLLAGGAPGSVGSESAGPAPDWQTVGAIAGAAVGVAAGVGGTLFGLHSRSKHQESDRYCDGDDCFDQRGVEAMNDAIVAGDRATVCFIVAGVGLTAAGVLWFVRPFDAKDPAATQLGIGPGRVELRTQW
ncbi:MAG TPA: tetratricopeptide repeat protein [Polyangiaceae bacterium]